MISIIIGFVSCKKNNDSLQYPDSIEAGETNGLGIRYANISNDTMFFTSPESDESINIDINGDGINDFVLLYSASASSSHSGQYKAIKPLNGNSLAIQNSEWLYIDTLSYQSEINNQLTWSSEKSVLSTSDQGLNGSYFTGIWFKVHEKYVGTRVIVNNHTEYGWIRVDLNNEWQFILIDYACTIGYE